MITTVLNTKISEVEKNDNLVKKTDYDGKISDKKGRNFTVSDYNKFTSDILDAKIKQKELVNKSDISILVKNSDLDTKLGTLARKANIKAGKDKTEKLQTQDLSYFRGNFFLLMMVLNKCLYKVTDYVLN